MSTSSPLALALTLRHRRAFFLIWSGDGGELRNEIYSALRQIANKNIWFPWGSRKAFKAS
jgi:hypothetical protein